MIDKDNNRLIICAAVSINAGIVGLQRRNKSLYMENLPGTVHYYTCQYTELHCTTKFYHFIDIFFKSYVRNGTTPIIILASVSTLNDKNYVVNYSNVLLDTFPQHKDRLFYHMHRLRAKIEGKNLKCFRIPISYVWRRTTKVVCASKISLTISIYFILDIKSKNIYGTHSSYTPSNYFSIGTNWWLKFFEIVKISRLLRVFINFLSS